MRPSFSLARGVAAIAMLLGAGPALTSGSIQLAPLEPEPTKVKPERAVGRDYSAWGRRRVNVPHIGEKQRRRHAGRPDGLMHRETPNLRSNANKRALAAQAVTEPVKKTRKPRAKKADAAAA